MMQMKGVHRVCALRALVVFTGMKYGEHVDDIHVLLHTYNDTHTQHSVKKYIYFIWRGLFSVEGLLFNWRRCVFHLEGTIFLCVFQQEQDSSSFQEEGAHCSHV